MVALRSTPARAATSVLSEPSVLPMWQRGTRLLLESCGISSFGPRLSNRLIPQRELVVPVPA